MINKLARLTEVFEKHKINTNALNEMLKRVQPDKKKPVIPNLFRNLEFGNDNKLIAFVLNTFLSGKAPPFCMAIQEQLNHHQAFS